MTDSHAINDPLARPWLGSAWVSFMDSTVQVPATRGLAVAALATGVAFDLAMRSGVATAAGAMCILIASLALLASRRVTNEHGIVLIALAPLFGMWLMLRTSDWLIPFNILAAATLLGFGASLARGGSATDLTIPELFGRVVRGLVQGPFGPGFLLRSFGGLTLTRSGAVVRGLLIAAPLILIVGALLTSADVVFASFFDLDLNDLPQHVLLIAFGTTAMAGLLRLVSTAPAEAPNVASPRLGAVETSIVLGGLNLLLGAFAAARLVALSEGGRRVIEQAGLTYAEYARTGFFQLVAVAVIVAGTVVLLRATADVSTVGRHRTFVAMSLGVVVLTLAVCVSAFHRLVLYEGAFGLTMLRVYVQTAIVWLAIALVLLGIAVAVRSRRAWLAPSAAAVGLVLLFALNVFDPEAFVARHNVTHPTKTDAVDSTYLGGLSDDAVGALLPFARGTTREAQELRAQICSTTRPPSDGWSSFNTARERAERARLELCTRSKTRP